MKIEKLNYNTLKIILTVEELSLKNITIKDIENGKKKAQNFFFDIIEDSLYADEFLKDDTKLLVEATVSQDSRLIVTITKFEHEQVQSLNTNFKANSTSYELYAFNNLDELLEFIWHAKYSNLFVGINSLYSYQNMYILIFSKTSTHSENFKKTYYALTEYCDKYSSKHSLISCVKENGKLLIAKNAINTLACYILE